MGYTYIVTQKKLEYLRKKKIDVCSKCENPFQVGDVIMTKSRNTKYRRVYHVECWKAMFL